MGGQRGGPGRLVNPKTGGLVVTAGPWEWASWRMVVCRPFCFGVPVRVPASGWPVAFVYRGTGWGVLVVGGCVALGQPVAVWLLRCVVVAVWTSALAASLASLDVGVRVGVLFMWGLLGVVGWLLLCTGQFVLAAGAWLVVRCSC